MLETSYDAVAARSPGQIHGGSFCTYKKVLPIFIGVFDLDETLFCSAKKTANVLTLC